MAGARAWISFDFEQIRHIVLNTHALLLSGSEQRKFFMSNLRYNHIKTNRVSLLLTIEKWTELKMDICLEFANRNKCTKYRLRVCLDRECQLIHKRAKILQTVPWRGLQASPQTVRCYKVFAVINRNINVCKLRLKRSLIWVLLVDRCNIANK